MMRSEAEAAGDRERKAGKGSVSQKKLDNEIYGRRGKGGRRTWGNISNSAARVKRTSVGWGITVWVA